MKRGGDDEKPLYHERELTLSRCPDAEKTGG
jgi:hypothetical protein